MPSTSLPLFRYFTPRCWEEANCLYKLDIQVERTTLSGKSLNSTLHSGSVSLLQLLFHQLSQRNCSPCSGILWSLWCLLSSTMYQAVSWTGSQAHKIEILGTCFYVPWHSFSSMVTSQMPLFSSVSLENDSFENRVKSFSMLSLLSFLRMITYF